MTPDPRALAVLLDAARACYGDDSEQVRWLLNPEAVRVLLSHEPTEANAPDWACPSCGAQWGWAHVHRSTFSRQEVCSVSAAWRDLGDPRGAADIERAHEEALQQSGSRTIQVKDSLT